MKNLTSIRPNTSRPARLAALKQSFQDWNNTSDVMARLARRLSTTLSLEAQLSILAEEMTDMVPFDSLNYRHRIARQDFVFSTGMGGPHRCEYRLSLEGHQYGTLTLHRRQRFSEEELTGIEMMLSGAICHIRNACQFIAIEQTALTDSLTGIGNKRALVEALQRASAMADRHGAPWSLILCDLDHFKLINDNHGHVVGDHILARTAEKLEQALRNSDTVYRFGGEEFAILLPHTNEQEAREVADRIRGAIESIRVDGGETPLTVTASCGVAMHLTDEQPEQWLARADEALYRAKAAGRNCTRVFASIS
ncbi:GGDEF domain-containing protein [Marinobacter nauticus]|uniref:GGDEF domain-containing protein n=1 Tax=Marinobacter nauticus TaxID=2743 RepID=UPI001D18738D|nr:GGDEF domain-containing protein [Marinobacter nauticus]MCC4271962.1 GGDEF domain-containing protein [Marinobacter nauticus]